MHPKHITLAALHSLLQQADTSHLSERARERLRWFLHYAEHGHSVGDTCRTFGISRATFHRWLTRFDPADPSTLEEKSRHPHQLRQSAIPVQVVEWIRSYRQAEPHAGRETIAEFLWRDHQVLLSPSTIGRVIEREGLYFGSSPLHWKKHVRYEQVVKAPAQSAFVAPRGLVAKAHRSTQLLRRSWSTRRSTMLALFVVSLFLNLLMLLSVFEGQEYESSARAQLVSEDDPVVHLDSYSDASDSSPPDAR